MKESFILKANMMSKCFKVNFAQMNVLKLDVKATEHVHIKVMNSEHQLIECTAKNDKLEFNLSNVQSQIIDQLDIIIYILDAFKSSEVNLEINYEYNPIKLTGDFHCHTRSSGDGRYTVPELVSKAHNLGLDFITTTDHNSIVANFVDTDDMLLVPGVELTNKFGHCNLIGKKIPLDDFNVKTYQDELLKINEATNKGAIFVANHPFSPKSRSWLVPILELTPDLVEIWNGPWGMHNRVAFEWWIDLLNAGKYIPAIGGSDFHFEDEDKALNRPVNTLDVRFNSAAGILESALNGRNIIKDTEIEFSSEIIDDKLQIKISNVKTSTHLYFYDRYNTTSKEIHEDHTETILLDDIDKYLVVVLCNSDLRDRDFLLITNPLVMKG